MYRIEGEIEFVAPFLFNAPSAAVIEGVDTGATGGKKTKKQKIDEAGDKVHRTSDGSLCVPAENLKRCIVGGSGSANLKEGKRGLGQYLEASVFVESDLSFGVAEPDEIHEHWGRIPPGPKGKLALIRRPMMKAGRVLRFALVIFDDRRNPEQIKSAMDQAGLYMGLGSWRPRYGRFLVKTFTVVK